LQEARAISKFLATPLISRTTGDMRRTTMRNPQQAMASFTACAAMALTVATAAWPAHAQSSPPDQRGGVVRIYESGWMLMFVSMVREIGVRVLFGGASTSFER
jgi:hypothetical protein